MKAFITVLRLNYVTMLAFRGNGFRNGLCSQVLLLALYIVQFQISCMLRYRNNGLNLS